MVLAASNLDLGTWNIGVDALWDWSIYIVILLLHFSTYYRCICLVFWVEPELVFVLNNYLALIYD
ncbi:hypothetical protein F5Y04DRAFT_258204 [Hypomontagnella monticulosa]|nr:hypothetical protein F5Y04DRAFT_258204 [Hypomontagnella monticulosa]